MARSASAQLQPSRRLMFLYRSLIQGGYTVTWWRLCKALEIPPASYLELMEGRATQTDPSLERIALIAAMLGVPAAEAITDPTAVLAEPATEVVLHVLDRLAKLCPGSRSLIFIDRRRAALQPATAVVQPAEPAFDPDDEIVERFNDLDERIEQLAVDETTTLHMPVSASRKRR